MRAFNSASGFSPFVSSARAPLTGGQRVGNFWFNFVLKRKEKGEKPARWAVGSPEPSPARAGAEKPGERRKGWFGRGASESNLAGRVARNFSHHGCRQLAEAQEQVEFVLRA